MTGIIQDLEWRYATKRMNGQKVSEDKLKTILDSISLTATSNGLQPFTVFVIEDEALRKKLFEKAVKQPQVVEGSHLIVFAAWKSISPEQIDSYFDKVYEERNMEKGALEQYANALKKSFTKQSEEEFFNWSSKQAYIALGTALVAAAELRVDSTPMEGFDASELDNVLGLSEKGMAAAALLAIGYRDESKDHLTNAKKVRRSHDELFVKL
ncbi:nitroreductase family protein [Belliella kenyensis]|uniref:Nitroreductase family protein n=1 Tax=Belliella kenyensis TaxID=1472724 RepID=A0ABV8EJ33_9BACT|nr:nitroreductase family protein [Belliella kenyensis]MCH7401057.1 nitroreductase family protein [Belliella kenyensis]MDN3604055.1 nitroreductase family protein [Belliella kenyensis]